MDKRQDALNKALGDLNKRYGDGAVMALGSMGQQQVDAISTGSLTVDIALGVGGVPRGRVTEVYGNESTGKTLLCLHVIAEAQKQGSLCAFVDMEHALDPVWARKIGVNIDDLYFSQPDSGEQALEITEILVRSGALDVIVIDSVAALVPQAEIDGDMGASHVGLQARLMSQALRKLTGAIRSAGTAVLFVNQNREKVGVIYGSPITQPGGRALKFYASVRMEVSKVQAIKEGGDTVGARTKVRVTKNKVSAPFREAEYDIRYVGERVGIDRAGEILDLGVQIGAIEKRGAFFRYNDGLLGQGRNAAADYLHAHPEIADVLLGAIKGQHKIAGFTPTADDLDEGSPDE